MPPTAATATFAIKAPNFLRKCTTAHKKYPLMRPRMNDLAVAIRSDHSAVATP
jgi:hypothetical protein